MEQAGHEACVNLFQGDLREEKAWANRASESGDLSSFVPHQFLAVWPWVHFISWEAADSHYLTLVRSEDGVCSMLTSLMPVMRATQ